MLLRSALYVPADKPRALDKARGLNADAVILDLEDAVTAAAKPAARAAACAAVGSFGTRRTVIRINALSSPWGRDDLAAVAMARPDAILLPKVRDAADIEAARTDVPLWAMIEMPAAVLHLDAIAASGVAALVLGSNDLLKEMGARHMPGRVNLQATMALCVLAARAHDIIALDGVHNAIDDSEDFARAVVQARDFGFDGKTLIHPSQIAPCNAAFLPSAEEIAHARAVIAAFPNAQAGVAMLDGRMVERLDAEIAARTLARAGL